MWNASYHFLKLYPIFSFFLRYDTWTMEAAWSGDNEWKAYAAIIETGTGGPQRQQATANILTLFCQSAIKKKIKRKYPFVICKNLWVTFELRHLVWNKFRSTFLTTFLVLPHLCDAVALSTTDIYFVIFSETWSSALICNIKILIFSFIWLFVVVEIHKPYFRTI